jgi:hypothetical protein
MHDALALSEILCSIFKFTDEKTDVSSVRVCKAWHEVVLDVIWYRVDRLDGLFKLLGPMGEMGYGLLVRSWPFSHFNAGYFINFHETLNIDIRPISYIERTLGAVLLLRQPCEATRVHAVPINSSHFIRDSIHLAPCPLPVAKSYTLDMEKRSSSTRRISYPLPSVFDAQFKESFG